MKVIHHLDLNIMFKGSKLYVTPYGIENHSDIYLIIVKPAGIKEKNDLLKIADEAISIFGLNNLKAAIAIDYGKKGFDYRKACCREHKSSYEIYLRLI